MPKIGAASIAEHVARQEAAVVGAARSLFAQHGVAHVTLSDIADAVGLKRTSIYRYFPTKSHIVYSWFESAMPALIEASQQVAAEPTPFEVRLQRWISIQVAFLTDPQQAAMIKATLDSTEMPDAFLVKIGARHRELYDTLAAILNDAHPDGAPVADIRTNLIAGLVRTGSELIRAGHDRDAVSDELTRSAIAIASNKPA